MFEHVGVKNYATYMDVVRRCLRDADGLSLLHTIGGLRSRHQTDPWIEKYIFPNSMLPSMAQIGRAAEGRLVIEDVHNFGADYDRTLMAWKANVDAHWDELGGRLRRPLQAHVGLVPAVVGRQLPCPQAAAVAVRDVTRRRRRRVPRRRHPLISPPSVHLPDISAIQSRHIVVPTMETCRASSSRTPARSPCSPPIIRR